MSEPDSIDDMRNNPSRFLKRAEEIASRHKETSANELAAALEKAWRDGYSAGYNNGISDANRYEWGCGKNAMTKRDENEAWNDSDTKTAIAHAR